MLHRQSPPLFPNAVPAPLSAAFCLSRYAHIVVVLLRKTYPIRTVIQFSRNKREPLTYLELHPQMKTCFEKSPSLIWTKGGKCTPKSEKLFSLVLTEKRLLGTLCGKNFQIILSLLSRNIKIEKPNPFLKFFLRTRYKNKKISSPIPTGDSQIPTPKMKNNKKITPIESDRRCF